jgi:predicted RNA binding protein YcfA (HicA-like mRNA interferase family)
MVVKALAKIGFQPVRQHGSHLVMKHPDVFGQDSIGPQAAEISATATTPTNGIKAT